MKQRIGAFVLIWAGLTIGARPAGAQAHYLPDHIGKVTYIVQDGGGNGALEPPATAAELNAMRARLREIADVVHASPMLRPPKGVDITTHGRTFVPEGCPSVECAKERLSGWLFFAFEPWVLINGKPKAARSEPPGLAIAVNDPSQVYNGVELTYEGVFDADGYEIFHRPQVIGHIDGFDIYDGDLVIIARPDVPFLVPVSQERYLRALIKDADRGVAAAPAGPAREMHESIRRTFVDELNALSPAERAAQAHLGSPGTLSNLVPKTETGASPLVRFNPAYFDNKLPRSTVQLMTLRFHWGGVYDHRPITPEESLSGGRLYQLHQALDYGRVAALVAGRK